MIHQDRFDEQYLLDYIEKTREEKDRPKIRAYLETPSLRKAAELAGVSRDAIKTAVSKAKANAAKAAVQPDRDVNFPVMEGFTTKRVSTMARNSAGDPQWVIQEPDKEAAKRAMFEAIAEAVDGIKPIKPINRPKGLQEDLLTQYTITDFHLGMYSWAEETGDDWDISIGEQVLVNAISDMMAGSPDSTRGVLAQMGDFLHWDGLETVTPTNKFLLDADTRYAKLARLALDVTENAIEMLLAKHDQVDVFMLEGNHDIVSSVWLRESIERIFRKNKRCTVHTSPLPYYAILFGRVFLGYHHGHLTRLKDLTEYFSSAQQFRPLWGEAQYTYLHCGHLHHYERKEAGGAIVEQHPTLAAHDSYSARHGYVNQRSTQAITYHKEQGEVARSVVTPRR